ncbi:MAG: exo-alpha-sialidase [Saprospiraceae bacterium]|nr:exo-alpha-sialidase [Saprospiraceae bacterium]
MRRLNKTSIIWVFYVSLNTLSIAFLHAQPDPPMVRQELIFPLQQQHTHGSSIVELPDGDLLAAWFQGSGERTADDVRIMGARLKKGASNWSPVFEMADTPDIPDCNPVLFLNRENKLFLIWIAVQANRWENSILRVRTTENYLQGNAPIWEWQDNILLKPGDSFAEEVAAKLDQLPDHETGWAAYAPPYDEQIKEASKNPTYRSLGWMTRIPPLTLANGRILLPLYSDGLNLSLVAISDDQGQTWYPSEPIVGRGPIQPSLIETKDGQIVAYMRDSGDAPNRVQISHSSDQGKTWMPAMKSEIPNTASVALLKLSDGRWVFVGNVLEDGRYQLMLWVSNDEGQSWSKKYLLENHAKGEGGYSYPCMIQTSDKNLHITYSYHLTGKEKSIKHIEIKSSDF